MRWWLGRECFATHKCILATREEARQEDAEDEMNEYYEKAKANTVQYPQSDQTQDRKISKSEVRQFEGKNLGQINDQAAPPNSSPGHLAQEATAKRQKNPCSSTAWYDSRCPPFALWVCGCDDLVDGRRLLRRFEKGREPHVRIVHCKIIEEYEHLDVIWAIDAVEQVGKEIKEVLWKTAGEARERCSVPVGCENIPAWKPGDLAARGATTGKKKTEDGTHDADGAEEITSSNKIERLN
jgi:hypothetical protein